MLTGNAAAFDAAFAEIAERWPAATDAHLEVSSPAPAHALEPVAPGGVAARQATSGKMIQASSLDFQP